MKRAIFLLWSALVLAFSNAYAEVPSPAKGGGIVQHITIVWLKEPGNANHRKQMIEGMQLLTKIPGVRSVTIGSVIPGTRNPSDSSKADASFDLAVIITLESEEMYAAYIKHPIHDLTVRHMMAPLIDRYKMYDVTVIK